MDGRYYQTWGNASENFCGTNFRGRSVKTFQSQIFSNKCDGKRIETNERTWKIKIIKWQEKDIKSCSMVKSNLTKQQKPKSDKETRDTHTLSK